jgi:hypothetical protein
LIGWLDLHARQWIEAEVGSAFEEQNFHPGRNVSCQCGAEIQSYNMSSSTNTVYLKKCILKGT